MAPIIHAAPISGTTRQLRRPRPAGEAPAASDAPPASLPGVELVNATTPAAAVLPGPARSDEAMRQASELQERAVLLETREMALAAASTELLREQNALRLREQDLLSGQQQLADEAAAVLADAERRGLENGRATGEREAVAAVDGQLERLRAVAQALSQSKRTMLEENHDMLVEIAFAAVCRVLGTRATSRAGILSMIAQLTDDAHALDQMTVRLHPQDAALIAAEPEGIDARLRFLPDAGVELGGCLIDSPRGTLDARLELQLQQLRETLVQTRRQRAQLEEPV